MLRHVALALALALCATLCDASSDKISVTAMVQGKKIDLSAGTVSDVSQEVAKQQGLKADRQSVFFKGKKLNPEDSLASAGVQDGDQIIVMPARGRSAAAESRVAGRAALGADVDDVDRGLDELTTLPSSAAMPGGGGGGGMPGMGGGAGGMMDMFGGANQKEVLEALSDPKKLEQSRLMLKEHPMFNQMAASVPGLAEAVNDPKKWKETMEQARSMMDQVQQGGPQAAEVRQAMESGMKYFANNAGGGPGGGLAQLLAGTPPKDGPASKLDGVDAAELSRAFGHTVATQAAKMGLGMSDIVRGMVAGARGEPLPMMADKYADQMARLLAKAGVDAGAGGLAHKGIAK